MNRECESETALSTLTSLLLWNIETPDTETERKVGSVCVGNVMFCSQWVDENKKVVGVFVKIG